MTTQNNIEQYFKFFYHRYNGLSLTLFDKAVLGYLTDFLTRQDGIFKNIPPDKRVIAFTVVAGKLEIAAKTVQRSIDRLIELNLVAVLKRKKNGVIYKVNGLSDHSRVDSESTTTDILLTDNIISNQGSYTDNNEPVNSSTSKQVNNASSTKQVNDQSFGERIVRSLIESEGASADNSSWQEFKEERANWIIRQRKEFSIFLAAQLLGNGKVYKKSDYLGYMQCAKHGDRPEHQHWSCQLGGQRGWINSFKCHGCDVAGDVFNFVMWYGEMDFPQALRWVADHTNSALPQFIPSSKRKAPSKLMLDYCKAHALDYYSLPSDIYQNKHGDQLVFKVNTINPKTGKPGVIRRMLKVKDGRGRWYNDSPHCLMIWGKIKPDTVFLHESPTDACSTFRFINQETTGSWAIPGKGSFNPEWIMHFVAREVKKLYLLFDPDAQDCRHNVAEIIKEHGRQSVFLINVPSDCHDISHYYALGGDLQALIDRAEPFRPEPALKVLLRNQKILLDTSKNA